MEIYGENMIDTIKKHLKDAMILKDKERLTAIRNILAKLRLKEIEKKEPLTKDESLKVLQSMAKQLKDSIDQYAKGNREDLANKEILMEAGRILVDMLTDIGSLPILANRDLNNRPPIAIPQHQLNN